MPLQFYKPQKNGKGSASSWSVNSKEKSVFVQIVKQSGDFGSDHPFKDGEKATVQLSLVEIGHLLNVLNRAVEYKTVHQSEKYSTNIGFSPYIKDGNHLGYGFSIGRQEKGKEGFQSFMLGYNFGEAETLKHWLEFALEHIFTAIYSLDKKAGEEYAKKKQNAAPEPPKENKADSPESELEI